MNCIKASRAEWKAKIGDSRPAKFSRISEPLIHVEQPSFGGKTAVEALEYINSAFEFDEHPQQTSEEQLVIAPQLIQTTIPMTMPDQLQI